MNAVAIPVPSSALAQRLKAAPVPQGATDQGKAFLKFDFQTGNWLLGKEQENVSSCEVLINTASIGHGWTMWVAGTPKKSIVSFDQPLPPPMQPEGQVYPQEARVLTGAFTDGSGEFIFETNSLGGRNGVDGIIKQVIVRAQAGHETFLYPIVTLDYSAYTHKTHGRTINTPVFHVVAWADINGVREGQQAIAAEPAPQAEPEPTRRRRSV